LNPKRILVADDDPVVRLSLQTMLEKLGYEVLLAADGDQTQNVLMGDDTPPMAIVDWMMPGRDGIDVCRAIRNSGRTPYTYIIMLTGRRDKEDCIAGLEAGADDYIRKPFDFDELQARVQAAERIVTLQQELRSKANQDDLTGLLNRGAILAALERLAAHAEREGRPLSVIVADLDRFKQVNDSYGHPVGDTVLKSASQRFALAVRAYDVVGRYGGEEFLILLPGCPLDKGLEVAERVRSAIADQPMTTAAGALQVTLSLGVAEAGAEEFKTDAVIEAADKALYLAKRRGGNCVEGAVTGDASPRSSAG
jgi:diguanylate cyclase (GGDEF)-like protein